MSNSMPPQERSATMQDFSPIWISALCIPCDAYLSMSEHGI